MQTTEEELPPTPIFERLKYQCTNKVDFAVFPLALTSLVVAKVF